MIDTFYRIKSLYSFGINIHLHCFEYGRKRPSILNELCSTVTYYPREIGIKSNFTFLPYNINSRKNNRLLSELIKDDFPILFDGIQTTYYIDNKYLKNRVKVVRAHNIEHNYYSDRAKHEDNITKSIYYKIESARLKWYESVLQNSSRILAISNSDNLHFSERFNKSLLVTPFHPFSKVLSRTGRGSYILYHGNLSVNMNEDMVKYIITEVLSKLDYKSVIAGMKPAKSLREEIKKHKNITLVPDPDEEKMNELISNAHITLPLSPDSNGMKLKLLYSLFTGRHCISNSPVIDGSQLSSLCHIADSSKEIIKLITELMEKPFTAEEIEMREKILIAYSNQNNTEKIVDIIYNSKP